MAAGSVLAFWAVALLLIVVPGADWAFTISAGLRGNRVLPAVAGLVTGYAAVTIIVAAGVGALLAESPTTLTTLSIVGGLYLVWHGVATVARPSEPATSANGSTDTRWATFVTGIGVSGLNPKGLLIFLALLPQFTDPHQRWPVASQIGVLGLTFMATCAVFYVLLGTLAQTLLLARPGLARAISRISGAAMIAIGAILLTDHLNA